MYSCTLSKYLATEQGKVRHDPRLHPAVTVSSRQEQSNLNVIRPGQGVVGCSLMDQFPRARSWAAQQ